MIARFNELKKLHGLDDEVASAENTRPKNIASGLICMSLLKFSHAWFIDTIEAALI